ncbi:hypothetical protein VB10N_00480 [Vibrio sp. 10N]|nr:hypothetical protein VB10N_00480 [Vibrio sp. 10N]
MSAANRSNISDSTRSLRLTAFAMMYPHRYLYKEYTELADSCFEENCLFEVWFTPFESNGNEKQGKLGAVPPSTVD